VPEVCAFTSQHGKPDEAQTQGASSDTGFGMPNGGLQVVNPSKATYDLISAKLASSDVSSYDFADQSLLGDVFHGRWVALPYTYNALKTLRWKGVHDAIWRDDEVKNIHYILSPKPWDEKEGEKSIDETHEWWKEANAARKSEERARGIDDGF
jgi:lipopolysaccharide biosynthesis glycosyltransferase